jgi:cytidylate kinase
MTKKRFAVAIDGPVGVGKSTTARRVAEKLGFTYIDTGAMFRAVALYLLRRNTDLNDTAAVDAALPEIRISFSHEAGSQIVYLNEENITEQIRTQALSEAASVVASYPAVREKLATEQKKLAENGAVVMDGRDIGTHILPWAQVKIFMDAAPEIRAQRRHHELTQKGQVSDFSQILEETRIRDERDRNRTHAPLVRADDAIYMDTGTLNQQEVVDKIITEVGNVL